MAILHESGGCGAIIYLDDTMPLLRIILPAAYSNCLLR
jgi:hypothetical protein